MSSEKNKILEQAEKYVKKGKLEEAIHEYKKILAADPQDLNIRSVIGDLYMQSGQKGKAISEFKKIADFYEKKGLSNQSLAIYKKINRLDPTDGAAALKLADLFYNQGFISEAKNKYLQIANNLKNSGKIKEALSCYKKVLKLDEKDYETKLALAKLYSKEGMIDKALNEFNDVAEFWIRSKEFKQAKEALNQARKLKEDDLRTLANLIEIFKKEKNKGEALGLINEILKKDKNNLQALSFLASLHFEDKNYKKAQEAYRKIIDLRPKDVEARIKLGRIHLQEGNLDDAYELYEPLVDSLLTKQKDEKAIGLLGLILAARKAHIPTLERLASIYKSKKQAENLGIAYKVILQECNRKNLKEKSLGVLREMVKIYPMSEEYYTQYRKLKRDLGIAEEAVSDEPTVVIDEAKEIIKETIEQADLYVEQGLIRNARRLLENLRVKYPDEDIIAKKINALNQMSPKVEEEEIAKRVEKVSEDEVQKLGRDIKRKKPVAQAFIEEGAEEKLTAADVFAETDIIPIVSQEGKEIIYFDLKAKIEEELLIIDTIRARQLRGDTLDVEKELSEIVEEFRRGVKEKISKEDYESHLSLGIAYLGQGLLDEAIEELELACQDEKRAVDCYSLQSYCFRRKKEYQKAVQMIEKALDLSKKKSGQYYGLKYELASLYEEMKERKKALSLYDEVRKWNPKYRDIADKIAKLERKSTI